MSTTGPAVRKVSLLGTGAYLPDRVMTNADLEAMVDTTDEWIRTRTGISERRIAREDESTSDMGAVAARRALDSAGISAEAIDVIIVATVTPDMVFPSTACFVQEHIGAKNAFCFDIEAACSGFLYGVEVAKGFLLSGMYETALVIGAEKLSAVVDWEDRATCVLFGDGAGAVVLGVGDHDGRGILSSVMGSDGSLAHLLGIPGGGSRHGTSPATIEQKLHYIQMEGNQVFKHAVRCMSEAGGEALRKAGLTAEDVDWVVPHQANMRIIKAISDRVKIPMDKFCINLDRVGNTTGASVPLALDEAIGDGRIKRGDTVLFIVFGGGFTWGAMVVKM
jgi:3-oxoacyl-[acyl-carrier-protein] synthase-3